MTKPDWILKKKKKKVVHVSCNSLLKDLGDEVEKEFKLFRTLGSAAVFCVWWGGGVAPV